MIRDVAGRQNHSVKLVHKLQQKKHRRERGLLVCEGMDLLAAALESSAEIRDVLVRQDLVGDLPEPVVHAARLSGDHGDGPHIGICDQETLAYASSLGGAADVIFTCVQPRGSLGDLDLGAGTTLFLDGVGDPGNVGTIVRSALAFGLMGVLCSPGTADPFGPKAMRAGMGAQFSLPVVGDVTSTDVSSRLVGLKARGQVVPEIWVAHPHDGEDVGRMAPAAGVMIVLGAERAGPGEGWGDALRVSIPQQQADSLNVAMAGTVFAYEAWRWRQRSTCGN